MRSKKDLLFLPVDLELPPKIDLNYLDSLSKENFWTDEYRNCTHLPIHHNYLDGTWFFTDHFPELNEWLENKIFPLTGPTRVVIICTPSGETNPLHIDCDPNDFEILQHKLRYVYRGNVDDLVFTTDSKEVTVPEIDKVFLMDGSWPHWMTNNSNEMKYTLAVGSPWEPDENDEGYCSLLNSSYEKYKEYYISSESLILPDNYEQYYPKKHIPPSFVEDNE
jgi:hypothetical protein